MRLADVRLTGRCAVHGRPLAVLAAERGGAEDEVVELTGMPLDRLPIFCTVYLSGRPLWPCGLADWTVTVEMTGPQE